MWAPICDLGKEKEIKSMKIKRKVQKNLPQLIEWAMDNGIKHRVFESNPNFDGITYKLGFDIDGDLYFEEPLTPTLLFTIEVEEEITEDTELPSVLVYDGKYFNALYGLSINDIEKRFIDYVYGVETIHLINGDTHTLIWRDGKLVD
ncbi:hypothetical protein [Staphylococcus equorum]|uniref:hypothetical protein n=1 Tax=Staphylococcus equorum TaxID=246432 RepID=UPI0025526C43|nr:hypothetical protein [Staphylococcus equorum]MDK9853156.1 hypothetical protein [Staphylococcus equorum]